MRIAPPFLIHTKESIKKSIIENGGAFMFNKALTKTGCIILTGIIALSVGCTAQKKPLRTTPKTVYPKTISYPNAGRKGVYPNVYIAPRNIGAVPRVQPPMRPRSQVLADGMAREAAKINGVNSASVMVVGRMAYVGLNLKKDIPGTRATKIKKDVIKRLKNYAAKQKGGLKITKVYVTADPNLVQRLKDAISGKNTPAVLNDLYKRIRMEK